MCGKHKKISGGRSCDGGREKKGREAGGNRVMTPGVLKFIEGLA